MEGGGVAGLEEDEAGGLRRDLGALLEAAREGVGLLREIRDIQHRMIRELAAARLTGDYERLGPDRTLEFDYEGTPIRLFLPSGPADLIQAAILHARSFYGAEMLEMVRRLVPMAGERVLDVGANLGNHTVFFSRVCGAREVEAFEPVRRSFLTLERNAALNGVPAILHNCGLGARSGRAEAKMNPLNLGGASLSERPDGRIEVFALDDLDIAPFRAMKIDVEGWAAEVLEGAPRTISRNRPHLVVEALPMETERVHAILTSLNYRRAESLGDDYVYLP